MSARYYILYDFKDGPWGGGNQFLKALRNALIKKGSYSEDPFAADVLLFNSHHFGENDSDLSLLQEIKQKRPDMPFIHRVDGPIKLIRGGGLATDKMIFAANSLLGDATIFQTKWSHEHSLKLGLNPAGPVAQIINAPDSNIFYPDKNHRPGKKLKLVASSWAANKRKGFDIYQYMDEHLDFDRYEMSFVGNIIKPFKNIRHYPPVDSKALADILRDHDIYITASVNDPCSNALCEGVHCGLPALVRNSGGHPEIMGKGGLTFENEQDVLQRLDELSQNHETHKNAINPPTIDDIADLYIDFANSVKESYTPQSAPNIVKLKNKLNIERFKDRIASGISRRLISRKKA